MAARGRSSNYYTTERDASAGTSGECHLIPASCVVMCCKKCCSPIGGRSLQEPVQGIDLAVDARGAKAEKWIFYPLAGQSNTITFGDAGDGIAMGSTDRLQRLNMMGKCWAVHRIDLHNALRRKCVADKDGGRPVEIVLSSKVVAWDPAGSVELSDGSTLTADLLVAADGIRSRAHEAVLNKNVPVQCNGQTAMRFMLKTKDIRENPATAPLMEDGPDCFAVYMIRGDKDLILRFPCQNNEVQNFAAYKATNSSTLDGEQVQQAELEERLGSFPESLAALAGLVEYPIWDWKITDRTPLPSYQKDRLVLVGDAARESPPKHATILLLRQD
jgi:2-polyprenyl-6-methoxyphenol hydroxylase-like FAD-dependent oxidoreductase